MKLKLFYFAFLAIVAGGLTSCGTDDSESFVVDIVVDNEFPTRGDQVGIEITAGGGNKLDSIYFTATSVDTNGSIIELFTDIDEIGDKSFIGIYGFTVTDNVKYGEEIILNVQFVDNNGNLTEEIKTIHAVGYMSTIREGAVIGHQWGPLNGGFDLMTGGELYIGTEPKPDAETIDLMDNSEKVKALANSLSAHESSKTQFIDLGSTYEIGTLHSINVVDVFTERSPQTLISVVSGTKFLAKLRGGDTYAVVHITEIDPDFESVATQNKGKYTFDLYHIQ